MYSCASSHRQVKNSQNPSFSSSLLEEIYKEIDDGGCGEERHNKILKPNKEKNVKITHSDGGLGGRVKGRSSAENEEMSSLKRACLMEKWMVKKVNEKALARGRVPTMLPQFDHKLMQDNDGLFFSSGSSSSDSSFGGFSSSETESSVGARKTKSSGFPSRKTQHSVAGKEQQSKFYLFDDYSNHQTNKVESVLLKSKVRARKIYANLKKIKQPISPGGRLATLINSIFSSTHNSKKNRGLHLNDDNRNHANVDQKPNSTCSTVPSFSRSCLSKNSPNSRQKRDNGTKRTVRFFPVSVIVDEDSRPCGHKCLNEEFETFHRTRQPKVLDRNDGLPSLKNLKKSNDFEDDGASDSSSDLFELDHISSLYNDDKYCDDLPVYETTHLGLNRAIANGFII